MADEFGLVGVVIIIKKSYGSIIINLFMGYEVIIWIWIQNSSFIYRL